MPRQLRVISVATCGECPFHEDRPFACMCAWDGYDRIRIVEDRDNQPEWCPMEGTEVLFTTRIHATIKELEEHNAVQIPDQDTGKKS